jgi:hypothetical protein
VKYISDSQSGDSCAIQVLEPQRANEIFENILPLWRKFNNSVPNKYKLINFYETIFEPLKEQFRMKDTQFSKFSSDFLDYALVSFYEEHFTSNQELSEALFGTGVRLTDLNGKEINWCFEIASLSKNYLIGLKKQFPLIDDDDVLTQLKREIFNFLGHHKTDPKSFVVNLDQTRYFTMPKASLD